MAGLSILSWNVRGLNTPVKRTRCLEFLHCKSTSIALIQESHLKREDIHRFQNKNYKILAHSCSLYKSKGVLILLKRSVKLSIDFIGGDDIGRFTYAAVKIHNTKLLLISIYAPNEFDKYFLENVFKTLLQFNDYRLVIGADFNASVHPPLDRSLNDPNSPYPPSTIALKKFIKGLNLVDPWRIQNSNTKAYTFYSSRHKTFSRIDYILTSASLLHCIPAVDLLPILISDHSPVKCIINLDINIPKINRWRFNNSLLYDSAFLLQLKQGLNEFLEINAHCSNPQILWETTKCFIRGNCIAYSSKLKKRKNKRINELEYLIKNLERQQSISFSEKLNYKLLALKVEYNSLSISKAEFTIHRTKQNYYFHSDRPSRLLAMKLKESESKASIDSIKTDEGETVTNPKAINDVFKLFYTTLYSSEVNFEKDTCFAFLNNLTLPTIPTSINNLLEEPITLNELYNATKSLRKGKSPGPDGIPPELYLAIWDIVGPLIFHSINHAVDCGKLHRDQNVALITLLLKKNKDPLNCSSYRPISLISSDAKIFAKALVSRVEPHINSLIHFDQTGFIRGRLAADNMRRLLHLMDLSTSYSDTCAAFSLDALKAFDRLEWKYLWAVLDRFKFGPNFIRLIQTLYNGPTAMILTGTFQSQPFSLHRGCRQGCPLSALLFTLSLEPLAQALRQSQAITPITIQNSRNHISLYADDIILFLSNLNQSVPHVLQLFNKFGNMSGYKINWDKSSLMPLNKFTKESTPPSGLTFTTSFTYLGIEILDSVAKTVQSSFNKIIQKVKSNLDRWNTLQISLQARVNIVKMSILPQFNFLFLMLPFSPPPNFFKEANSLISKFIWSGKRARISSSVLQHTKRQGGLGLPNLEFYFWAFQIRAMRIWIDAQSRVPWRDIEASLVHPSRLQDLPFMGAASRKFRQKLGPIISCTLLAWQSAGQRMGYSKKYISLQSPLWHNPQLLTDMKPFSCSSWSSKGVYTFADIFDSKGLRTFQAIQKEFSLPSTSFFLYLKLRAAMKTYGVSWNCSLVSHIMLTLIRSSTGSQGVVSRIYKKILESSYKPIKILAVWDRELAWLGFYPNWETVWSNLCISSKNLSHVLIHFKTIHRMYCTPYKRYLMKRESDPYCKLCKSNSKGTFLHMFWDCSKISSFWKYVICKLSIFTSTVLNLDPCLLLLNDDSRYQFSSTQRRLLMAGLTSAKKTIVQRWFSPDINMEQFWITSFYNIACLECSTAKINKASQSTVNSWSDIIQALKLLFQ